MLQTKHFGYTDWEDGEQSTNAHIVDQDAGKIDLSDIGCPETYKCVDQLDEHEATEDYFKAVVVSQSTKDNPREAIDQARTDTCCPCQRCIGDLTVMVVTLTESFVAVAKEDAEIVSYDHYREVLPESH